MRVVIIERDRNVRQALAAALARCGFEPVVASSSRRGLHAFRRVKPALLYVSEQIDTLSCTDVLAEVGRAGHKVPIVVRAEKPFSLIARALRTRGCAVVHTHNVEHIMDRIDDLTLLQQPRDHRWYKRVLEKSRRLVAQARSNQARAQELRERTQRLASGSP